MSLDEIGAFDLVRVLVFAFFGVGVGFMVITNYLAFTVLRPAQKLGFLWWHVTSISIAWLLVGSVGVNRVIGRLGDPPGLASILMVIGTSLFMVAQVIIFSVERQRYVNKKAMSLAVRRSG